jgi:hypothetical protein
MQKVLDYILFQIEEEFKDVRIQFGSGLSGKNPSKSPLFRSHKMNLIGDTFSDVDSPVDSE